jgi:hypothetical protein
MSEQKPAFTRYKGGNGVWHTISHWEFHQGFLWRYCRQRSDEISDMEFADAEAGKAMGFRLCQQCMRRGHE